MHNEAKNKPGLCVTAYTRNRKVTAGTFIGMTVIKILPAMQLQLPAGN
ncbi:hypothetical protein FLA_5747 [Filimonas lacunae]|nr:hypothetical protein FLA_5747 [Filimonas lacunae]